MVPPHIDNIIPRQDWRIQESIAEGLFKLPFLRSSLSGPTPSSCSPSFGRFCCKNTSPSTQPDQTSISLQNTSYGVSCKLIVHGWVHTHSKFYCLFIIVSWLRCQLVAWCCSLTRATDTTNIRLVFAAVKETILQSALNDSGILWAMICFYDFRLCSLLVSLVSIYVAQSCSSVMRVVHVFSTSFIPGSLCVVHLYPHTSTNPYHTIIVILTRALCVPLKSNLKHADEYTMINPMTSECNATNKPLSDYHKCQFWASGFYCSCLSSPS